MELVIKNPPANAGDLRGGFLIPGSGPDPLEEAQQPTPVFLSGESHGQRSLKGYSPKSSKKSETTRLTVHAHRQTLLSSVIYITSSLKLSFGKHNL